jgi:hypothetical protein
MTKHRRIIRVSLEEFELDDGSIFPIVPPLEQEMTPDEFQKHYDYAVAVARGCRSARGDDADPPVNGQAR